MTLVEIVAVLRRHRWMIVLIVALCAGAALLVELSKPATYEASASVLVNAQNAASLVGPAEAGAAYRDEERFAQTQRTIAMTPGLVTQTLQAAGVDDETARSFLGRSTVRVRPNENILDFYVRDPSAAGAMRLATEYARQFPVFRQDLDEATLARARSEVQQRIRALEKTGATGGELYDSLVTKRRQLAEIEALQTTTAQLLAPADRARQVTPRPKRSAAVGLLFGLLAAGVLVFATNALSTRTRSPEDIAEMLGLPLLARLPRSGKKLDSLVTISEPLSPPAEAFRILRTNLDFVNLEQSDRVLLVTSALASEGKSTTTANLAVSLAQIGHRVVVVECDLRKPSLAELFGIDGSIGVTDVARNRVPLARALIPAIPSASERMATGGRRRAGLSGVVDLLPAGPLPPNPGEFVTSPTLVGILDKLRAKYDFVLIDSPPVLQVGDAMALSRHVDAVLIVVRLKEARRDVVVGLSTALEASPAHKLGFVVTDAQLADGARGPYGYYQGYHGRSASDRGLDTTLSPEHSAMGAGEPAGPRARSAV